MKCRYLVLPLVLFQAASLFGAHAAAAASAPTPEADTKSITSAAADVKQRAAEQASIHIYFEQWINKNSCPAKCPARSQQIDCDNHCNEKCIERFSGTRPCQDRPCRHMSKLARNAFEFKYGPRGIGTYEIHGYNILHTQQAVTRTINEALPTLLPALIPLITEYYFVPERLIVLTYTHDVPLRPNEDLHPFILGEDPPQNKTEYGFCYNLDTSQVVIYGIRYGRVRHSVSELGIRTGHAWSDVPFPSVPFPSDIPPTGSYEPLY